MFVRKAALGLIFKKTKRNITEIKTHNTWENANLTFKKYTQMLFDCCFMEGF